MDYALTKHARDAWDKRQLPLAWMERALSTQRRPRPIR